MTNNDILKISRLDWEKRWMERFTLYSASLIGECYYYGCKKELGVAFAHCLFVYNGGMVTCYQLVSENTKFGKKCARQLENNTKLVKPWNSEVKNKMQLVLNFTKKIKPASLFKNDNFDKFDYLFGAMQPKFVRLTRVASYISKPMLPKLLPPLNKLRLETEDIYGKVNAYAHRGLKNLAKKERNCGGLIEFLFADELRKYIKSGNLPSQKVLAERKKLCGLYFSYGHYYFLNGEQVKLFEKLFADKNTSGNTLKGASAVKGKVSGRARVVLDPKKAKHFNIGDILVTSMTYLEFLPLIKKCGAIVTDGGGVLCHAAIVARELKKPCVINTQVATQTLKDGDLVEVDANQGIVIKI